MEKGVKGSDECCISICDFSPQPFDILRRHLPVFSVSTSLTYQLSLDQLSQLSASACLCLKEQVRHLTALCYCVSAMWTKSSWNLISDCLLFNFNLNFESTDLHSEDCHDIGGRKKKRKKKATWTEAAVNLPELLCSVQGPEIPSRETKHKAQCISELQGSVSFFFQMFHIHSNLMWPTYRSGALP